MSAIHDQSTGGNEDDSQSGFSADAHVAVRQIDDKNWAVLRSFTYTGDKETFVVPVGAPTDFASVPRVFTWFLPSYGKYTLAAILHDYLWRELAASGRMNYIDADGIFCRAMRQLGVPFMQRWIMWAAVRWAALFRPRGRNLWWREALRVVLVSALALPLLAPPGAVVAVGLVVVYVVELIVFLPLAASRAVKVSLAKGAQERTNKQVNLPEFRWRL